MNGDGILDVVTATCGSASTLFGRPDGTYDAPVTSSAIAGCQVLCVGDMNEDGVPDLVALGGNGEVARYTVELGTRDGRFADAGSQDAPADGGYWTLTVADMDGDGHLDLVGAPATDTLATYRGDGHGNLPAAVLRRGAGIAAGVVAADFDGDGMKDLAVIDHALGVLEIYRGTGDGALGETVPQVALGRWTSAVALGDLDRDGALDMVALRSDTTMVCVLAGDGHGHFTLRDTVRTHENAQFMGLADVNRDGAPDLVMVGGTPGITVRLGHGDGTFGPRSGWRSNRYW